MTPLLFAPVVPSDFDFTISPFDCLGSDERRLVRDSVDVQRFDAGQTMLECGAAPGHLFIVASGSVQQWSAGERMATHGPHASFDGRALFAGRAGSRFVAAEAVLAYRLPVATVRALVARNASFGALWFADIADKLGALTDRHSPHELRSLTMARVDQTVLRTAHVVDAATDIVSVARLFTAQRASEVLVRDDAVQPPRVGIFTSADLQRAILQRRALDQLPVGELANFGLATVAPSARLFDAMALMIRHHVQRLVVVDRPGDGSAPEGIVGILGQVELLGFLSNHSTVIARRIGAAMDLGELQAAALQITRLIGLLHGGGTKVGLIARLVQELNAKLFERAWQLIAPAELVANSCLFVMGSEGRGEQLLKTDQDNGLVLRDGYAPPADLDTVCRRFSQALASFGYPECPGRIMVSNAEWRHDVTEFGRTVRRWLLLPTPESLLALAIFLDAHAVAGEAALLAQVRDAALALATDDDALLARFAAAVVAFDTDAGWLARLLRRRGAAPRLDLKKAGIFPIVHGARSLALAHRIQGVGTTERIEALVAAGALNAELGVDLIDSLHFFMELKLKLGLAALPAGAAPDAGVDLNRLGSLERDLLRDTLVVVKRFKALLRLRFHLDAL